MPPCEQRGSGLLILDSQVPIRCLDVPSTVLLNSCFLAVCWVGPRYSFIPTEVDGNMPVCLRRQMVCNMKTFGNFKEQSG